MTWIWSGDTLMDLSGYEALKMELRKISGEEYLFVEVGGFRTKNPAGWQSPWYVLQRRTK